LLAKVSPLAATLEVGPGFHLLRKDPVQGTNVWIQRVIAQDLVGALAREANAPSIGGGLLEEHRRADGAPIIRHPGTVDWPARDSGVVILLRDRLDLLLERLVSCLRAGE